METALRIRNILFKAFCLNFVLIVVAWLASWSGIVASLMTAFFGFSASETQMYMAHLIGFWKILNAVFFLIPAVAIHWEYKLIHTSEKSRERNRT
ncbi:MAG: hypothetical protein LBE62_03715 [Azonexus sp.]|jgi:hypothetical protein|nr:hypothetical protein [Azonexus sp.]